MTLEELAIHEKMELVQWREIGLLCEKIELLSEIERLRANQLAPGYVAVPRYWRDKICDNCRSKLEHKGTK